MRIPKKITALLAASLVLLYAQNAWALYGQPTSLDIADWIMAVILVVLAMYVVVRVGFNSRVRFRVSLALVILNGLVLVAAHAYAFYIEKTIKGWDALRPLGVASSILCFLWLRSIPISVLVICALSKRTRRMTLGFLVTLAVFCAAELSLNYAEIDGYLSAVEKSNYRTFKDDTAIRNYLSASGASALRLYPKERTKKVLLAELKNDSWATRYEGASGLEYLRDASAIPHLVDCLHVRDETDTSDQAREACAVTLQMLLSRNDDLAVYNKIHGEHEKDPGKLFERLESEAKASRGKE